MNVHDTRLDLASKDLDYWNERRKEIMEDIRDVHQGISRADATRLLRLLTECIGNICDAELKIIRLKKEKGASACM